MKKPITLFCFFMCPVALNWKQDFLPLLLFNTLQHAFLSSTAFFSTTPFYFFTGFYFTTPLSCYFFMFVYWFHSLLFRGVL